MFKSSKWNTIRWSA